MTSGPKAGAATGTITDLSRASVKEALRVVRRFLAPTPLVRADTLGDNVFLKLESLQPLGSFKVRGALVALSRVPRGERVVTVSAGNHALGIGYAASALDVDATVVVPETVSSRKLDLLRRLPVQVIVCGSTYEDAREEATALAAKGYRFISPFNNADVVLGQGTVAEEIFDVLESATLVCPLGGGGLASGLALVSAEQANARVVAVEAAASMTMQAAIAAGHATHIAARATIADGITGNLEDGSLTIDIVRDHGVSLVAVEEFAIEAAIRELAHAGVVAEGAAATPVAALMERLVDVSEQPVVLVITGRNIDSRLLARVLTEVQ